MSTFYGGEQVATVFTINRDTAAIADPGTAYTVPANRYAIVHVLLNRSAGMVFSPENSSIGSGGDRLIPVVDNTVGAFSTEFIIHMSSGNTLKSNAGAGVYNYQFLVLEYFKS